MATGYKPSGYSVSIVYTSEDAYEKMVDTAVDNLYNDTYWREQFSRDVWIHKQLELL